MARARIWPIIWPVGDGRQIAQGELPQGEEVSGAEEPVYRRFGHIPDIDLPCPEAEPQLLRGNIDEPDLISSGEERIRGASLRP